MENTILSLLIINVVLDFIFLGVFIFKKYYFYNKPLDKKIAESKTGLILHFKDGVKSHRLEIYRNITVVYLEKPSELDTPVKLTYHFFWNGEVQFGESYRNNPDINTDLDILRDMVVREIDKLLE